MMARKPKPLPTLGEAAFATERAKMVAQQDAIAANVRDQMVAQKNLEAFRRGVVGQPEALAAAAARDQAVVQKNLEAAAAFSPERLPTTEARLRRALATDPDPMTPLVVRVRASTKVALEERARATGTKPATLARSLIEAGLAAEG